jgi:hypothetical protein
MGLSGAGSVRRRFAFTELFIGLIASFWRGRASAPILAASLGASALVHVGLGSPWHVAAGALAGIGVAYARAALPPAYPFSVRGVPLAYPRRADELAWRLSPYVTLAVSAIWVRS